MKTDRIELPPRDFLYTLDQIATLTEIPLDTLKRSYIFYEGRNVGVCPKTKLKARDISADTKPDWRVTERGFVQWLRFKGFKYHSRSYLD